MKRFQNLLTVLLSFLAFSVFGQAAYYIPAENYGGKEAMKDLFRNEMVYPEKALNTNKEGKVKISFTIAENGKPIDVKIVEPVCESIDAEALRLFNHLLWTPANSKGTTIPEKLDMEIPFKIKKYKKQVKHRGYDKLNYPVQPVDKSLQIYMPKKLDTLPKPVYSDHIKDFTDFMIQNLKYPATAKKQGVSGTVDLFFVVEPSGNISNYKIENGVGAGCNEEAIRLMKLLHWIPGIKNGKAIRTAMKLSITFDMEDSDNMRYVPANNANQI